MPMEFRCTDADGAEHVYEVRRHRGSEGLRLVKAIAGFVIEPLASALGPVIMSAVMKGSVKNLDASVLAQIDLSALGRGARSALQDSPDELAWAILKYTNRDGKPLVDNAGKPTTALDEAYGGNYLELGKALWEVCSANNFFAGLDSFVSAASRARDRMAATDESAA